jgi:hypothetical protein
MGVQLYTQEFCPKNSIGQKILVSKFIHICILPIGINYVYYSPINENSPRTQSIFSLSRPKKISDARTATRLLDTLAHRRQARHTKSVGVVVVITSSSRSPMWSPIYFFTIPFTEFRIVTGELRFKFLLYYPSHWSIPLQGSEISAQRGYA